MAAQQQIRGLVRAVRHLSGRQVRQTGEDLVDLRAQPRRLRAGSSLGLLVFARLAEQRRDVLAALFGGADLTGDAVAPGLRFLRTCLGGAPRTVERQHLFGARRQAAPDQAAIEFRRVIANPPDIVHRPN